LFSAGNIFLKFVPKKQAHESHALRCLVPVRVQIFCFLFPSWSLGTQLCRTSSFGEPVPKLELGNEGKDHLEILASSLESQRVSAAGEKLELPGQGVPKLELWNEGKNVAQ
jgi:hypothetical protein